MGYIIVLQDEKGKAIETAIDSLNCLDRLLPLLDDSTSRCLKYVDPYGDTIFNRMQMPDVLSELEGILNRCESSKEVEFVNAVKGLALLCKKLPHLYLKFRGD